MYQTHCKILGYTTNLNCYGISSIKTEKKQNMHVINRFGMTWLRWNLKQLNHTLRCIRVVLQTKWYICWISYWLQSFNSPNWWRILSTDSIFPLWKSKIDGIRKHIFLGTPYVKLDATSARMHVFIICFAGFHTPKTRQLCHLGKWLGVTSEKVSQWDCLRCLPVCGCIKLPEPTQLSHVLACITTF